MLIMVYAHLYIFLSILVQFSHQDFQPIRIYVYTDYLNLTFSNKDKLSDCINALNKAKNTLEKIINVERETVPIDTSDIFTESNSYHGFMKIAINDILNGNVKPEVDLVVFIRALDTDECKDKNIILKRNQKNRTTIGYITFDEILYSKFTIGYREELLSIDFLHQITHLLGFKISELSNKRLLSLRKTEVPNRISNGRTIEKYVISSTNLINFAQSYFNCPTLEYIELEDYYQDKCEDNLHWEARILNGEYMTSFLNVQDQAISEFTLILLDDTELYQTNKYTGGLMKFGKHVNCSFFNTDCNYILPEKPRNGSDTRGSYFLNEFCSGSQKTTCSSSRTSRGICQDFSYSTALPTGSPYFRSSDWGPYGNKWADYCPISIGDSESDNNEIYNYIGNCKLGKVNDENIGHNAFLFWDTNLESYNYKIFSDNYGENFSDISFCAFSSVIHRSEPSSKRKIYQYFVRPTCYQMFCSQRSLTIRINTQYIVCPRQGGFVSLGGDYEGHLLCPDYNLICSQTEPCNNMFDCVDKKSLTKDLSYEYTPFNVSIQILLPGNTTNFERAFELSDDGKCPIHCSECNLYRQCFECHKNYSNYVGVSKGDDNPINCYEKPPADSYYNTTEKNKTYFYQCTPNCKECVNAVDCDVCHPEYNLIIDNQGHKKCEERIKGCEIYDNSTNSQFPNPQNNYHTGYNYCLICNQSENYYCLEDDKTKCIIINEEDIKNKIYYYLTNKCVKKCEKEFTNCLSCNISQCIECKSTHYLNRNKVCVERIPHCYLHDESTNPAECEECDENYHCINDNRAECVYWPDMDLYFEQTSNKCIKKCSDQYQNCKNCIENECKNCIDGYFVYNQIFCIESLEHCLNHFYDGTKKECKECENNYYCVNRKREICEFVSEEDIHSYYNMTSNDYPIPCIDQCRKIHPNCLRCSESACEICKPYFTLEANKCNPDPELKFIGNCSVRMNEITTEITKDYNEYKLADYPDKYYVNFPSLDAIDHYINKDFTITVYLNSDCTESLLNQGYFKIDSKELLKSLKENCGYNSDEKFIYALFITHNFKSHLRFYDKEINYINTAVDPCKSCEKVEYTITNKYKRNVDKALGKLVGSLVESEKINIFETDSDVFNNKCQNVTFLGIDMPLKIRLLFLYPHTFSDRMACLGEDCVIEEFNLDESTCTCKCKMGNTFKDILSETKFTHYDGPLDEVNNFIDSINIIQCIGNGFNSKNIKANAGSFICIIAIAAQVVLYIYYSLCSKPISNTPKMIMTYNPPKKTIILFSDWDKKINKKNTPESEIFIQPRDDAEEQLLEEEKSYSNDDLNASSFSADTNVGDPNKASNKNKLKISEKSDRKILILLKNKSKSGKSKDDNKDMESDNEILKLNDKNNSTNINFCKIYWFVVSLKQHIINYFSCIHCCKITKSYIPLSIRIIRSLFLLILSFVFNILFLNQKYYEKKFNFFNEKYVLIHAENVDLNIPTKERISYALSNTITNAIISGLLLVIVNFIIGILFFSVRKDLIDIIKNKESIFEDLVEKTKKKNLIFFIINIILMIIFFLVMVSFLGAYGGGFVDYFIGGIISLIFLEIIPFLWSIIIALLIYIGIKNQNKCCSKFGQFFMF